LPVFLNTEIFNVRGRGRKKDRLSLGPFLDLVFGKPATTGGGIKEK
jgi:hypothetical protein